MKKTIFILSVIIISISIFSIRKRIYVEDYKHYVLPPVIEINAKLKPLGSKAWMPTNSIQITKGYTTVYDAQYFPDGQHIAVALSEGRHGGYIEKWNLPQKKRMWQTRPFNAYGSFMGYREVEISPNGKYITVVPYFRSQDHNIGFPIIEASTGRVINMYKIESFTKPCEGYKNNRPIMLQPWKIKFSKDSSSVFVYYKNQYDINYGSCKAAKDVWLIKWNIRSRRVMWKYKIEIGPIPEFNIPDMACRTKPNLDISPNGREVVYGNCNGEVISIHSRSGREKYRFRSYLGVSLKYNNPGTYRINYVKFNKAKPNDLYCVVSAAGRKAIVVKLNMRTKEFSNRVITAIPDDIPQINFSRDGRLMTLGNNNIYTYDLKQKMLLTILSGNRAKINPKYKEIMAISSKDIYFIHQRQRHSFRLHSGWQNTRLHVSTHTGYFIQSKSGRFYQDIDVHDNQARAYSYSEMYHSGDNYHKTGYLYLKPNRQNKLLVSIIGGLLPYEKNWSRFRQKLSRWGGRYPSVSELGGRIGINSYQPIKIIKSYEEKKTKELSVENINWKKYSYKVHNPNEALEDSINREVAGWLVAAIKKGADVNHKNSIGIPYFFYTAKMKDIFYKIFIHFGVNIEIRDDIKKTPIMKAAYENNVHFIKALLKAGANINARNFEQETALMYAGKRCKIEAFKYLVNRGAKVYWKNKYGKTAYKLARQNCDYQATTVKIERFMRRKGLSLR